MKTGATLAVFGVVLAATVGGAMVVGQAVGPIDVGGARAASAHDPSQAGPAVPPRGLSVADGGFRLAVETPTVVAGGPSTFRFQILDDVGQPVTGFDELHERRLHLIVLSRDLVEYHHLHPVMEASGQWHVPLPALEPGSYRVFADFQPAGAGNITLGADIAVPGLVRAAEMPVGDNVATIDDDYTVELLGSPQIGDAELTFTVRHEGRPVVTAPYLGAAGHLVAIRVGDLAYVHVHPNDSDPTPVVSFTGEFPTAGTYRLFFDFSHDDQIRTAAFTVLVPDGPAPDGDPTDRTDPSGHEGH